MATITTMNTSATVVYVLSSRRVGQITLRSSATIWRKNSAGESPAFGAAALATAPFLRGLTACLSRHFLTYVSAERSERIVQGRRDSNPQPPVLETGDSTN